MTSLVLGHLQGFDTQKFQNVHRAAVESENRPSLSLGLSHPNSIWRLCNERNGLTLINASLITRPSKLWKKFYSLTK